MAELLYRRVYDELRDAIHAGTYAVGERLPPEAELLERFRVSQITLKRALDLLRADGYIVRRPRLGTFVVSATATSAEPVSASGRPLLGAVLTSFDDTFGTRVLEGLLDPAEDSAHVIVTRSSGEPNREDALVRGLVERGVAGLALLPSSSEFVPPSVLELVMRRFPVVILDRVFEGVPVSSVSSDNEAAAQAATAYLFELGHRHVGFVSSASHVSSSADRRNGYLRAHAQFHEPLDDANLHSAVEATVPGSGADPETDIERLREFVEARPQVTAYLATEYNIALLLREACRRAGRDVPGGVSIVCFDHPPAFADAALFRFTHVRQQQREIGRQAVEQLLAQLAEPELVTRRVLDTELVIGASTAPR